MIRCASALFFMHRPIAFVIRLAYFYAVVTFSYARSQPFRVAALQPLSFWLPGGLLLASRD